MRVSSVYFSDLPSQQNWMLFTWERLWDVVEEEIHSMIVQLINLQKFYDEVMSAWTRVSKECFQHLVEPRP